MKELETTLVWKEFPTCFPEFEKVKRYFVVTHSGAIGILEWTGKDWIDLNCSCYGGIVAYAELPDVSGLLNDR